MDGGDGAATSVLWTSGVEAFPSCLVVMATTTILYSVKGPAKGTNDLKSLFELHAMTWSRNSALSVSNCYVTGKQPFITKRTHVNVSLATLHLRNFLRV